MSCSKSVVYLMFWVKKSVYNCQDLLPYHIFKYDHKQRPLLLWMHSAKQKGMDVTSTPTILVRNSLLFISPTNTFLFVLSFINIFHRTCVTEERERWREDQPHRYIPKANTSRERKRRVTNTWPVRQLTKENGSLCQK